MYKDLPPRDEKKAREHFETCLRGAIAGEDGECRDRDRSRETRVVMSRYLIIQGVHYSLLLLKHDVEHLSKANFGATFLGR